MNSKKNFINFNSEKIVNKINDLVIGEDSNDYLTVNSETRFHSDVNIGGSSIRLHSSDNTNSNNFISILDQNIHSVHAQTLRKIQDLQIGDNNGKYLKFDNSSGLVASTVSGGGGGGGSGIVNNRIDGDLTIGEDNSEMLTIASKLHIPGGKSGQVLTKGTDGSIEYGPTSFPTVSIPSSGGRLIDNVTITGNSQNVTLDMGADYADYEYFEVIGVNVVSDTDGYLLWRGKKVSDNSFDTTPTHYGHSLWTLGNSTFTHDWGVNNRHEGTSTSSTLLGSHALNNASPGPHNFRLFIYGLNKNAPTSSDYTVIAPHGTNNSGPYKVTGGTWQPSLTSNYIICNKIVFDTTAHHSTTTLGNLTSGTLLLYGYKTSGTTFTTANPLLANPSTTDKGKIVTVNAAGDDLEYGAGLQEKNYKYKMLTGKNTLTIPTAPNNNSTNYTIGAGAVLFNDGTDNLEVTITPSSNSSQILISADIMGEFSGYTSAHHHGFFTLQKTQNGTSELIYPSTYNSYLASANINYHNDANSTIDTGTFRYVDTLTSNSPITYCVAIVTEQESSNIYFNTNGCGLADTDRDRERGLSIITAEELGGNAITSFTQEQALAGAGGTAAFTNTYKDESGDTDLSGMDDPRIAFNNTINNTANSGYWHNQPYNSLSDLQNQLPIQIGINFTTSQIVTKYRIWARTGYQNQAPKSWQIRAAIDKATYDSGTFIILDSRNNVTSFPATSTSTPSDNLSTANEYNLSTIGAYQYYVFYFTESNGGSNGYYMSIGELALYGGGFTIPSQIGHTGRLLTTDGTSLGWSTTSALPSVTVPEPTSTNKGRALVSTGTGIEFSDFNSGVSTGFKVYKSGTSFEEVTAGNAVLFDQTTTNVGAGSYSTTAGTYTVPVTGYYNIFANFINGSSSNLEFVAGAGGNLISSASSSETHPNHPVADAYDNLLYDYGGSLPNRNYTALLRNSGGSAVNPIYIKYELSSPQFVREYYIWPSLHTYSSGTPKDWTFQGSNDDSDWTILDTRVGETNWNTQGITDTITSTNDSAHDNIHLANRYVISGNVTSYKYFKIVFINNNGESYSYRINEFALAIYRTLDYRIQKSTDSGTTYTDLVTSSDKPTTSIVESLNQNDLIRVISGDGSTGSTLNFEQGSDKNSFGAHLLNSGNSTSSIPIYGFNAQKNDDHINPNGVITGWSITENSWNFSEPTSNFNTSSGLFTIPISGYYKVCAMLMVFSNNDSSNFRAHIEINGDTTAPYAGSLVDLHDQTHGTINISTIIKLNKDDTIGIYGGDNGTIKGDHTSEDTVDTSTFSCFLLASDTQTNTRQMGLSPIVPLHQLGHDQFADGTLTRFFISQGIDPDNLKNYRTGDGTQNPVVPNSTQSINSTFTSSTLYYNYNGTNYTTVPASPYSSSSTPNWDYLDYIYLQPILNTNAHSNTYICGSFTIDTSKILENYTGLWALRYTNSEGIRFKINGETFYNNTDSDGSTTTFGLYQKYINVEYVIYDIGSTENLIFQFHQTKADNHIQIAEPVMPSITLPTPNSNNNGKVLVSNGSGYALENSGARNQSYIAISHLTAEINVATTGTKVTGWDVNNLINVGSNFSFSDSDDTITIKNVGYYRIKTIITFYTAANQEERNLTACVVINGTIQNYNNGSTSNSDNSTNYISVPIELIRNITTPNSVIEIKVFSSAGGSGVIYSPGVSWIIEDMTPSAVPSINIPLPVAAHAGKALTVNSQGTGLEYGDNDSGDNDSGALKEYISGFCNGHSVSIKSGGTLTFQNVTAYQGLDQTFRDITGSTISYLPPTGTTLVVYEFIFTIEQGGGSQGMIGSFKFYIDNVEQTGIRLSPSGHNYTSDRMIMKVPIRITGTTSSSDITLASWNTSKTIKIMGREWGGDWQANIHKSKWFSGSNSATTQFNKPTVTIIAK